MNPAFFATLFISLLTIAVAWRRRLKVPSVTRILLLIGLISLCVTAANPRWQGPQVQELLVMVDLSPSTRTAAFRNRPDLEKRIRQLLGNAPYRLEFFASDNLADDPTRFAGPQLPELATEQTRFNCPMDALCVLLFSDARFPLPAAGPPMYPVIDPQLERVTDAAVERLEVRAAPGRDEVVATVRGSGTLALEGVYPPMTSILPGGNAIISRALHPNATFVAARFADSDAWPENNALSLQPLPPFASERWWIGDQPPDNKWHSFPPEGLPTDSNAFLAPAVIVLDDIPADALGTDQQDRLQQYVQDLGGSVLIVGGEHAFAAGGYPGSGLDAISPLASTPPHPTQHWLLLLDSSGSMGDASTGDQTKWQAAASAITRLLKHLPPSDIASIGDFAGAVRWWSAGRSVAETSRLVPPEILPRGPTNLESVLMSVAAQADADLIKQLVVVSDVEAVIEQPARVADALNNKKIHLHVMAIGSGEGSGALREIIRATAGSFDHQVVSGAWANAIRKMAQHAMPQELEHIPAMVRFKPVITNAPPPRSVTPWNHAWLKPRATQLDDSPPTAPLAAHWRLGSGQVMALAYSATPDESARLADIIATPPRDPRLHIHFETGPQLKIDIDAKDAGDFLNDLSFTLQLGTGQPHIIPQIAPGEFRLTLDAPRQMTTATVRHNDAVIDRIAIPARYASEFDAVGNDHAAMHALADRTGGQVIDVRQATPIDIPWPRQNTSLVPMFAIAAATAIATAMLWWRRYA